jgi:hypothetical protein
VLRLVDAVLLEQADEWRWPNVATSVRRSLKQLNTPELAATQEILATIM